MGFNSGFKGLIKFDLTQLSYHYQT